MNQTFDGSHWLS